MKTWIKVYTEILDDYKLAGEPVELIGWWALLLALAGKIDDRDGQEAETGRLDTLGAIAWHLRKTTEELMPPLERLIELKMVHQVDGVLYITNYGKRQARPRSARPTAIRERVQRHRARKQDQDCNEDVTRGKQVPDKKDKNRTDKIQNRKDTDTDEDENRPLFGVVYGAAESGFGRQLTETEGELLQDIFDEHPELDKERWEYVFKQAAIYNVRNLGYIQGVLDNLGKPKPGQGWYAEYSAHIKR